MILVSYVCKDIKLVTTTKIVYVKMKDVAIKMYKMKKYFMHNHKENYFEKINGLFKIYT